jgi:hypothetical protein
MSSYGLIFVGGLSEAERALCSFRATSAWAPPPSAGDQDLREFGILLQEMPLGCNALAARIRIDRSRQPLLFWWFGRGYRQALRSLGLDGWQATADWSDLVADFSNWNRRNTSSRFCPELETVRAQLLPLSQICPVAWLFNEPLSTERWSPNG